MIKNYFLTFLCLIVTGFFLSLSVNAKMYKWVDEDGHVQYSQSPPNSDVKVEEIKPPGKVDTDSAQKQLEAQKARANELSEKRLESKNETAKSEEEAAQKVKRCDQARARLKSFQRPRVNLLDEDGNRVRAKEEDRLKGLEDAKKYLSDNCK
jgi:uncharacterized protein DUF4124